MDQDYKKMTRMQAERAIVLGDNELVTALLDHGNYHVRRKAWVKLGSQLPEGEAEQAALRLKLKLKAPVAP